jgi:hypothetical protein
MTRVSARVLLVPGVMLSYLLRARVKLGVGTTFCCICTIVLVCN